MASGELVDLNKLRAAEWVWRLRWAAYFEEGGVLVRTSGPEACQLSGRK